VLPLILLFSIIIIALILFIGGWISVDLVGLLVLATLALSGLVSPTEALAGFSNSAVITVLALFILSAGLSRTGVAYNLGRPLQRFSQSREWFLVIVLMITGSILSALMNTTTVAVILLPTVMDLARRSGRSPSRLLLPMSLGCLLGGPFTAISTSTNMMVVSMMENAGLTPFGLFDFTPITGAIALAGIAFVVLFGLRLLPQRGVHTENKSNAVESSYGLEAHIFSLTIHPGSPLAGRTLSETRLGSALQFTVVALLRRGEMRLSPRPTDRIEAGDTLIVHGSVRHLQYFRGSHHLRISTSDDVTELVSQRLRIVRGIIGKASPLLGKTLAQSSLRRKHRVHVLSLETAGRVDDKELLHHSLAQGDALILMGEEEALENLVNQGLLERSDAVGNGPAQEALRGASFMSVYVPPGSILADCDLTDSRLGTTFGLTAVAIQRDGQLLPIPMPEDVIRAGDTVVLYGAKNDLEVFRGLQELIISEAPPSVTAELESQQFCATEVLLSPRTRLTGRTLADLRFREQYGLNVLAIWRNGRAHRTGFQELPLQFGDAILVYGPRESLAAVSRNPDFLVLDKAAAQAPLLKKAPWAAAIMLGVILSAILGLVPISIAALTGATLMVLSGCLSMDEAYRSVEWKVIFLIASLLPLGVAFERTGAAQMVTETLVTLVGDLGPRWVVASLFLVTALGTQVVPPAALVVLISPVALGMAVDLGISPHLLMMTVAMAAAASFASPVSHPAHLLVMGPGGYRFIDYFKIGVPLTFIALVVCVWLLPLFWPA